ncbi:hypothetical protein MARA_28500 [Mycolicibacterium arabiense]|uniref:Glycosyltransferase subfamily 4-like N-terminal domain-containing protein n=1 Tax=Mycolicibacterium arabiense TaxID=1286181 RepID=A0A7I7RXN1_9MYCO|nr:glycosyltransferase [Mycolicibacterium arabiense]MCV7374136.1 glycosyltransferase [Mycolicibacterium arabiense]BBY49382.1 hypothetical protein MARA_28500 [Mycolicibacterium arabiense]
MRVCFFIANLGDGGAQRQCVALLNALQHTTEIDLHLILLGPGQHESSLELARLRVHRTEVRNFADPRSLVFVIRTLRRLRPDLLISWLHPADIWSYAATRVIRRVPWVLTERGSTYPDEAVYNVRKRFGSRGAAAIIANSRPGSELWESLAPRGRVMVIPNMVLESQLPPATADDGTPSVDCLFVGRLERQKNVSAMTAAFTRFAGVHPQSKLVVVGSGTHDQDVRRIAVSAGMESRVHLLGFRSDVPTLMAAARVLLSFSLNEGMPNVVMEAVAVGLPAVVSDIPEHRALLGADYPFYVRLDATADEAAEVISAAWTSGAEMVEHAYSFARGVLRASSPDRVVAAYVDAFADVVARENDRALRLDRIGRGQTRS